MRADNLACNGDRRDDHGAEAHVGQAFHDSDNPQEDGDLPAVSIVLARHVHICTQPFVFALDHAQEHNAEDGECRSPHGGQAGQRGTAEGGRHRTLLPL